MLLHETFLLLAFLASSIPLSADGLLASPAPTKRPTYVVTDATSVGTLSVPTVGCGTLAWSNNDELPRLVETARDVGGAFFDTGERYGSHLKTAMGLGWGETESLVGELVLRANESADDERRRRPDPIIATKFTPSPWRTTAESVVGACEASRRRLGVESIDLYQIQMPDIVKPFRALGFDKPNDEAYWEGLAECYHRGMVKNVGVSNYGPTLVTECQEYLAKRGVPLASNQIAYSLIGRRKGSQQTLDKCNELGVRVLAYYPLAFGLLTGKYTSGSLDVGIEESLLNNRRSNLERKDLGRYANGDGGTIPAGGVAPLLRVMEDIASERGVTVAQVALNYVICKGAIPIPGARSVAQFRDNVGSMGWRLSDDEVSRLETEADALGIQFEGAGFKRSSEKFVGYGMEKWSLT